MALSGYSAPTNISMSQVTSDSYPEVKDISDEILTYANSSGLCLVVYCPVNGSLCTSTPFGILLLAPNTLCCFRGKARLTHLAGPRIQILGALINPDCTQSYHLFSPNVQAFITISQFESGSQISCFTLNQLRSAMLATFAPVLADSLSATVSTLVDKMDTNPSVLLFYPHACRISESISFIKKFRSIYELDGLECLPCDSNIMKTLGFCFSKCDSYKGFRASPHMFRVSCKLSELWERSRTFRDDDTLPATHDSRSPSVLIAGPKGAGKSSLLRFIINYFLTADQLEPSTPTLDRCIAVLDCDVGQPEFTPNGMVSLTLVRRPLFGPPFTHQTLLDPVPVCQCFVGCISPSDNPKFYLQCLAYIYDAYKDLPEPRPPLLVNTMGWTQGLGFALLVEQILLTKPHIVVQIHLKAEQPGARQNLPILDQTTLRSAQGWNFKDLSQEVFKHELVIIPSMSFSGTRDRVQYGAPDHRDLTMLAYFMAMLANARTSLPPRGPEDPLGHPVSHFLDCLPYRVPVTPSGSSSTNIKDDFHLAIRLMHSTSELFERPFKPLTVTVDTILACLNATLVALCAVPPSLIERNTDANTCSLVRTDPVCECLGFAICRAVDTASAMLYLTTGIPEKKLMLANAVVRGNVNLPLCFFLEQPTPATGQDSPSPFVPPYLGPLETQGLGRLALPSRRSYPRTLHRPSHRTGSAEMFDHL